MMMYVIVNTIIAIVIGVILFVFGIRKFIRADYEMSRSINTYEINMMRDEITDDEIEKKFKLFPSCVLILSQFFVLSIGFFYIEFAKIDNYTGVLNAISYLAPWGIAILYIGCVFYVLGYYKSRLINDVLSTYELKKKYK